MLKCSESKKEVFLLSMDCVGVKTFPTKPPT